MPICTRGGAGAVRVDDNQLRAPPPGLLNKRPEVNVVSVNVRGPRDDVLGMAELLGVGANIYAVNRFHPSRAGLGTNISVQLRRAQPVKEAAIHRAVAELAQSAAVGKRQDRFAAKFGGNALQPFG